LKLVNKKQRRGDQKLLEDNNDDSDARWLVEFLR
jgi:hypothetical protein